jgi:hypothetical protein
MDSGIFGKKLVHKCNKRGMEGGKNLRNQKTWRVEMCIVGGKKSKSISVSPCLLER